MRPHKFKVNPYLLTKTMIYSLKESNKDLKIQHYIHIAHAYLFPGKLFVMVSFICQVARNTFLFNQTLI